MKFYSSIICFILCVNLSYAQSPSDIEQCGSGFDGMTATIREMENAAVDAFVTLSIEDENYIGRMAREMIKEEYTFIASPLFENALSQMLTTKILDPYISRKGLTYTLTIVQSDEINAFATPGGYIYVTTGLLTFIKSADELAFIVGHEVSHIDMEHVNRGTKKQMAIQYLGQNYGLEEYTEMASDLSQLVEMPFGQIDEYEADYNGFLMARAAGFDPMKFADFFKRMIALGRTRGSELEKMQRSHPYFEDRINCINYYIQNY